MWGFAIFCEYPGCQKFEAVTADGEIPSEWFSVDRGDLDVGGYVPESVGTFCGWGHMLESLHRLAPDVDAEVDIRHRGRSADVGFDVDIKMDRR